MWIPPETIDPVLFHHPTRRSVGYFGAVRLRDGKLIYRRETKRFNAETCFAFLRQLWAVCLRSDRKVIVITDNVRYHHAALHKEWREAAEPWFKLEFLRRFLLHLLPKGFVRIRHFGFLASRRRGALLPLCFQCLGSDPDVPETQAAETAGLWKCPKCGGPMIVVLRVNAPKWLPRPPPASLAWGNEFLS
jgi:hypothetical protein